MMFLRTLFGHTGSVLSYPCCLCYAPSSKSNSEQWLSFCVSENTICTLNVWAQITIINSILKKSYLFFAFLHVISYHLLCIFLWALHLMALWCCGKLQKHVIKSVQQIYVTLLTVFYSTIKLIVVHTSKRLTVFYFNLKKIIIYKLRKNFYYYFLI